MFYNYILVLVIFITLSDVTCDFRHFPSCEDQLLGVSCGAHTSALSLDELPFPMDPLPVVSPLLSGLRTAPRGATSHLMGDIYKSSTLLQHQSDTQPLFKTFPHSEQAWMSPALLSSFRITLSFCSAARAFWSKASLLLTPATTAPAAASPRLPPSIPAVSLHQHSTTEQDRRAFQRSSL